MVKNEKRKNRRRKEKMAEDERKYAYWQLTAAVAAFIFFVAAVLLWVYITGKTSFWKMFFLGVIPLFVSGIMATIVAIGVEKIPYPEVWVIDRLGELIAKGPGVRIVLPVLHVVFGKAVIEEMQDLIELFTGEEEKKIWMDFAVGGSMRFVKPHLWVSYGSIEKVKELFGKAKDPKKKIQEEAEHAVRSQVNSMAVEEVVPSEKSDLDQENESKEKTRKRLESIFLNAIENREELKTFLGDMVELEFFTTSDYTISDEVMQKRREKYESGINVEIADKKADAAKREIGDSLMGIRERLKTGGFSGETLDKGAIDIFRDKQAAGGLRRYTFSSEGEGEGKSRSGSGSSMDFEETLKMGITIGAGLREKSGGGAGKSGEKGEGTERKKKKPEDMTGAESLEAWRKGEI